MAHLARRRPPRGGQSTVEYMLVISVLVIGVWAAAQLFVPAWMSGLGAMQADVAQNTRDGVVAP